MAIRRNVTLELPPNLDVQGSEFGTFTDDNGNVVKIESASALGA